MNNAERNNIDPNYANSIPPHLWDEWKEVTRPFKEASARKRRKEQAKQCQIQKQ